MKKSELLKLINDELLEKLFGFCYARTDDSHDAQELCSDIIFELVKTASKEGEIVNEYAFIWRVARNVYASFCEKKKRSASHIYDGDAQDIFPYIADAAENDESEEMLTAV